MVNFEDRVATHEWFNKQPSAVAVVLAARAALRVLPLVAQTNEESAEQVLSVVVLPCFRAAAVSWAVAKYPGLGSNLTYAAYAAHVAAHRAGAFKMPFPPSGNARSSNAADAAAFAAAAANANITAAANATACANDAAIGSDVCVASDVTAIEQESGTTSRAARAAYVADTPLWPGGTPIWALRAWEQLKTLLSAAQEDWEVWIAWYEDRLAGQPSADADLDIARVMLTDDLWEQGPKAVNAEIRRLMEALPRAVEDELSEPIPHQGAGPHFTLGPAGMIALVPATDIDAVGNNIARISQLLPLVRRAAGDLIGHLNPNAFPELARDIADYHAAVAGDEMPIAWGTVFGLGVMLERAAEAARRKIEDRLQPPLEDAAQAALDAILTLHGPLILATAEGRELAEAADNIRLTREEQAELRDNAQAVATELKNATEIIEPRAAKVVEDAAEIIGKGPHPERGTVFGISTMRNVAVGIVGVAAVSATFGIGIIHAGAALIAIEALKKSEKFSAVTSMLGENIDRVFRIGAAYRSFVVANQEPLRRIAANTTQLRWMLPHIDRIVEETLPKRTGAVTIGLDLTNVTTVPQAVPKEPGP